MKARGSSSASKLENISPEEIKRRNLEQYGSRIKAFRTRAGLSSDQLADVLHISRSSVRNWECGLTRPDPEFLVRMFSLLDVEPNEFFGLRGVGSLLTGQEKELIAYYRSLDRRGQGELEALAEGMARRAHLRKLSQAWQSMILLPDRGRAASAGTIGTDWPDEIEETSLLLLASPLVCRADEVMTVNGDSMEPQFHDGEKVLMEYCAEIRNGDIGIFYVPGVGGVIKQKAYDRLHSLNPAFDDIFPYEEGAQLVGRVLGRMEASMIPSPEAQRLYWAAETEREKDPALFDAFDE